MTTYTATFRTPQAYAVHDIEADSAEAALEKAHALYQADPYSLSWYAYDSDAEPLEEIEIENPAGSDGAVWQNDDLSLRFAAPELLDALTALISQIDSLHGESSCIDEDIQQGDEYRQAVAVIAKAKGGAA